MLKKLFLVVIAAMLLPQVSNAAVVQFMVGLDGIQSGTGSPGTGSALVLLDDVSGAMTINGSFMNLNGTASNAHLHGFTADPLMGNGGVLIGLTFTAANSGTFSGMGLITGAGNIDLVKNGHTYINLHSSANGGGEIRGFLSSPTAVPEPSTTAAMALLAVVGIAVQRRKKAKVTKQ